LNFTLAFLTDIFEFCPTAVILLGYFWIILLRFIRQCQGSIWYSDNYSPQPRQCLSGSLRDASWIVSFLMWEVEIGTIHSPDVFILIFLGVLSTGRDFLTQACLPIVCLKPEGSSAGIYTFLLCYSLPSPPHCPSVLQTLIAFVFIFSGHWVHLPKLNALNSLHSHLETHSGIS
jgi:hypothetical protein